MVDIAKIINLPTFSDFSRRFVYGYLKQKQELTTLKWRAPISIIY